MGEYFKTHCKRCGVGTPVSHGYCKDCGGKPIKKAKAKKSKGRK